MTPPHDISGKVIKEHLSASPNAQELIKMMKESYDFLMEHPVNKERIKKGEIWRLVSSSLLHIGTWHIVSNITAMLIVGYAVETQLGFLKTAICFCGSALVSGLFMAFVYKLQEGEGASTGIYGLIAVFLMLAIKNGTLMFSGLPLVALIILAIYTIGGMLVGKATAFEHVSGFTGGLLFGLICM
jgi:membrane associated rhomboid family serine protease